ncbi:MULTISPECIES: O-antigen ligase family protein [unclassified Marinobacterium]|uniref:O-antigen ligase family protein n=1 Tax=unclassified Marinobacterium TaxID=2644139 RepID=UPI0015690F7C|nr:O-Antigen ligase [Marinobacterium sp. xm-d-420]NRP56908.1 O-Antigen ligase [Marinobacterium sp. xm-d-510]NRP96303.1 O-Antigen ligase [Marinobacterium sp. xm-a-127]
MLSFLKKNDLTILLSLYFFMMPIGKTLWYPLLVMAIIGAVLFVRELKVGQGIEAGTRWLIFAGLCVWVPAVISFMGTIDFERTMVFVGTYPLFFLAGYFLYKRLSNGYNLIPSVIVISLIVVFWGALAIWQYIDPQNPFGPGGSHNQGLHTRDNPFVDGGLMMGVILGSLFGFLTLSLWSQGWYKSSIVLGVFIIFLCFISGTRSSWLSILVTLGIFALIPLFRGYRFNQKSILGSVLLISAVVFSGSYLYTLPGLSTKFDQTFSFRKNPNMETLDRSLSGRINIWSDAVKLGAEYPLTGTGVNNFRYAHPLVAEPGNYWIHDFLKESNGKHPLKGATHTHQMILEAWSGAGVWGVLGLVVLFVFLIRTTFKTMSTGSLLALGGLTAFWAGFFPFNTHNNFYGGWMNAWFWVWLGISAGLIFSLETKKDHS